MRLSNLLYRRIRHDFLPVYVKKQWRETGSVMTARRLRVPESALRDPRIAVTARAEDTFVLDTKAASQHLLTPTMAAEEEDWRRRLDQRLAEVSASASTPPQPPHLIFKPSRLFCRDLAQAAMLTNTVVREGPAPVVALLQESVASELTASETSWVREAVERSVLHAHVWQTDEDRLPMRFNPELVIWKFKTEYGIHPTNVARYLLHNLFRLCHLQSVKMNGAEAVDGETGLPGRWLLRDRHLETWFRWGEAEEAREVHFNEHHDLALISATPTPLFEETPTHQRSPSDQRTLEEFRARMHLISPLIDLTSTTQYREDSSDGILTPKYPHPNVIGVNVALPNTWSDFTAPEKERISVAQRQAIGLMHCHASCVATARRLYGDAAAETGLPRPVAIEAVCTDGVFFDFISYQLNTLAAPDWSRSGLPATTNVAWVDGNHELVHKRFPKRSMLRNTRYTDLNMDVFYRLLARYHYGAARREEKVVEARA